ncbi:MAG: VirB3 family type IV secretion system protein [Neisseriaceae bacterium]|nr:VirB3 family type IV secretion system protein [Neisseriaceae bacterium]
MSDEPSKLDIEYSTYGALEREAMFLGVPLIPAAVVIISFLLLILIGMSITQSTKTLLLLVPCFVILIYMKQVSVKDSQALRIIGFELLCFFYRRNAKMFGGTHTILSTRYGRRQDDYKRFLEQNNELATCDSRLSTENLTTHHT